MRITDIFSIHFGARRSAAVLGVLRLYLDDSGSHGPSPIVVTGGFLGTERQWADFEAKWADVLAHPPSGRPPLKELHMYDMRQSEGEYVGWKLAEFDLTANVFRSVIKECGLEGFACAVSTSDYERHSSHPLMQMYATAEGMTVMECMLWAHKRAVEEQYDIAFVLDDRDFKRQLLASRMYQFFRAHTAHRSDAKVCGLSFASSETALPLQAADMLAWEARCLALDWHKSQKPVPPNVRLDDLCKGAAVTARLAMREQFDRICSKPLPFDNYSIELAGRIIRGEMVLGVPEANGLGHA